jgi:hypothetical protein
MATTNRALFEHVIGKTDPGIMTDGEIIRELATATGERRAQLEAEQVERERLRASDDPHYPVEPL